MNIITYLKDLFLGKMPYGAKRSSAWPKVRAEYLKEHLYCECCGSREKREVHHCYPFHLFPELELEESNLKVLCEKSGCHFSVGHLYSWMSYNPNIREDLKMWSQKVKDRP